MYATAERLYRNLDTGETSLRIYDVVKDRVTLNPAFSCGGRQGTWKSSPFREIEVVAQKALPEIADMEIHRLSSTGILQRLYDRIYSSIEHSWDTDAFHVVFHSSGYDSRIISGIITKLCKENGKEWLGRGLLFLSNRWEASSFRLIMDALGWSSYHYAAFDQGSAQDHFALSLNFATCWRPTNAPTPCAGNLRWYLVAWAQEKGLIPGDISCVQGYTGLWANETWNAFLLGDKDKWIERYEDWYIYNQMAALPWKIPVMEYPLSDLKVLEILPSVSNYKGDDLRCIMAEFASPQTRHIPRFGFDDWGHKISGKVRKECAESYSKSWYGKHVKPKLTIPSTSGWSNEWGYYGLASLCERLIQDGVKVKKG